MKIKFWGVRGSIPVPGPQTVKYGGNTSCVEVQGANGEQIILDAGTGIRLLGLDILKRGNPNPKIDLFISHTHWDHIQGFPFFGPCYVPTVELNVKGPIHFVDKESLQNVFDLQMQYEFFPISNQALGAKIDYHSLKESALNVGNIAIRTQFMNHPILCLGYRLTENGKTFIYTGDHEPYHNVFAEDKKSAEDDNLFGNLDSTVAAANERFIDFIRKADVLVVDCQYTPEEYRTSRKNWGHSSWDYCIDWMLQAQIGTMFLTHHDPLRSDQALEEMLANARKAAKEKGLNPEKILLAQEGLELTL